MDWVFSGGGNKGNEANANKFSALGWAKFSYKKLGGKIVHMNYWLVPEELIDNQELFNELVKETFMFL